jgi:hypothetical protein
MLATKLSATFLTALIGLLVITACGDGGQAEREALRDEVMAVHDEVMPKMGDLRKTRKSLEALADSLRSDTTNTSSVGSLMARATEIEVANEAMMGWMRQYNPETMEDGTPHEEVMSYLKEQKTAIEKVRDQMNQALAAGEEALK